MKIKTTALALTLIFLCSSHIAYTQGHPKPENTLTTNEVLAHILERVNELEKKVESLDGQMEATSKQAFLVHGLYLVRPGDTLATIAELHGLSTKQILELNEGINPKIEVAQLVRVRKI